MKFDDLKFPLSMLEDGILVVGPACCELAVATLEKSKRNELKHSSNRSDWSTYPYSQQNK